MGVFWGAVAVAALWWPGTVSGPLDGAPLDGPLEAIALGLVLPALRWFHHEFPPAGGWPISPRVRATVLSARM